MFGHGTLETMRLLTGGLDARIVNLPHDYMIESDVREDAPAGPAGAYYTEGVAWYSRKLMIPQEWADQEIFLHFDGVMMNATVEINGAKAALQHYGYAPFYVNITKLVYFGQENRVTITVNPSMQPNSRWYSGAGIFRSMELVHTPKVHLDGDAIYAYTDRIEYAQDGTPLRAYLKLQADVCNQTMDDRIISVEFCLKKEPDLDQFLRSRKGLSAGDPDDSGETIVCRRRIQVNAGSTGTAYQTMIVEHPSLWDVETPSLYRLFVRTANEGVFKTRLVPDAAQCACQDEDSVLFGIRTVMADAVNGLQINGKTVKLRGGCLHHDNGILGAVSLFDAELRKLALLKESGFNAVRTTHNPPSAVFMEACDRLGIYVFDEAFDAWNIAKQPGDYSQFFYADWKKDVAAFIRRDRSHPSVIIWSTGNEIPERGGLGNGYVLATEIADYFRSLDSSRPISNGICSYWSGLDDTLMSEGLKTLSTSAEGIQNADIGGGQDTSWEALSECFTNGLDIVGYNYMENKYERSHELFPERVILGSENYPNEIGIRWPMVESTPYVIGDFTWTAYDYIGEAGIGKSVFLEPDDPLLQKGPFALMSHTSPFPWRTANDADFDINGRLLPQGAYRRVVWGDQSTYVFSYRPEDFDRKELISMWGFTGVRDYWNWKGSEGKPVKVAVFSLADEVELFVNGAPAGRQKAGEYPAAGMPRSFVFETTYVPGCVEAVSYKDGREISRGTLVSSSPAADLQLAAAYLPESILAAGNGACACGNGNADGNANGNAAGAAQMCSDKDGGLHLTADGHSLCFIEVSVVDAEGRIVQDEDELLCAEVTGAASLAGFGSGATSTAENYTKGSFTTYHGMAMAAVRAGEESGEAVLTIRSARWGEKKITLKVE